MYEGAYESWFSVVTKKYHFVMKPLQLKIQTVFADALHHLS